MEYRRNADGSITEIPPAALDCGHPYRPGAVTVGYGSRQLCEGQRMRWYRCNQCGHLTYADR